MPRKPAPSQPRDRMNLPPTGHIRWLVDRLHVGTSPIGVIREMSRRMPRRLWSKRDRKAVYRMALVFHRENQHLYRTVTGSI